LKKIYKKIVVLCKQLPMTTLTIKNTNGFSLVALEKLLNSLDIEVVKIEDNDTGNIPEEHWQSIQKGLKQLDEGLGIDSDSVRKKAREICFKPVVHLEKKL
jgi:hypothetical protein